MVVTHIDLESFNGIMSTSAASSSYGELLNTFDYPQENTSSLYNYTEFWPNYEYHYEDEIDDLDYIFQFYVPPILMVLGSFSNILTIVVIRRKTFAPFSISFYLLSYCVINLLTLFLFLGSHWIADLADVKTIDNQADWLCRLWQFILRVISYSGIWFVVAMLIDRYIRIWHPWKVSSMCTKFMAKFVAVIIMVGLVVISIHAMWTFELMVNGCFTYHKENDIHAMLWPWMSASFYSFIPLVLLFVFFVLVLTGLCLKRPYKHTASQNQNCLVLTQVTLGLSMSYFLLTLPPTIINIVEITYPPSWLQDRELMKQLKYAKVAGLFMGWTNTIIIFYICLILSRTFRKEFMEIVRSMICLRHQSRIYELQAGSQSSATQVEMDVSTETPFIGMSP